MFTDLRLKIINFLKKYKYHIILFLIFWGILIVISQILTNTKNDVPFTTFEVYKPVIDNGQTMPEKWQDDIESIIDEYIGYCNRKEYEKAYNMISKPCRDKIYPDLDSFKAYVDYVFSSKRLYTIKNYSNRDNVYIYRLRIFEDIMATGLTYSSSFKYFEEKISFTEKDGKLSMGVKGYISEENQNGLYDDKYIKISIAKKYTSFDNEIYTVQFKNKTEYDIVISENGERGEIELITANGTINRAVDENWTSIHISPGDTVSIPISFTKFFDEGIKSTAIRFNNIRVLRSYSEDENLKQQELENAVDMYSAEVTL